MIARTASQKAPKKEASQPPVRYAEAVGRRKTAVARVRLVGGAGELSVNGLSSQEYFKRLRSREAISTPLKKLKVADKVNASIKVSGGGVNAQAEAVRHGIARALVLWNPEFKKQLRQLGFLTRDPRMVERKKYGLKKARRAPQWAKR